MTLIDRYIQSATLRGFAVCALGLTTLFGLLELVDQFAAVGQGHYTVADAILFVLLRMPARLVQVSPVAMLLGTLLALGGPVRYSELVALRAVGVAEWRIAGTAAVLALPISCFLLILSQWVIPPAQKHAQELRATSSSDSTESGDSFWVQGDHQFLNVRQLRKGHIPEDIDLYNLDSAGMLTHYLHADRALIRRDGSWLMTDVMEKTVHSGRFATSFADSLVWQPFITEQDINALILPVNSISPLALIRFIASSRVHHRPSYLYEQELWSRISLPFSMVGLLMVSTPFLFGASRTQNAGSRIGIGVAIAIIFSLAQQTVGRLGVLYSINPMLTALTPSVLLMLLAAQLFLKLQQN